MIQHTPFRSGVRYTTSMLQNEVQPLRLSFPDAFSLAFPLHCLSHPFWTHPLTLIPFPFVALSHFHSVQSSSFPACLCHLIESPLSPLTHADVSYRCRLPSTPSAFPMCQLFPMQAHWALPQLPNNLPNHSEGRRSADRRLEKHSKYASQQGISECQTCLISSYHKCAPFYHFYRKYIGVYVGLWIRLGHEYKLDEKSGDMGHRPSPSGGPITRGSDC